MDFRTFQFPDSAQYNTARGHVFCEYLRENEFFSETILSCFSATQMGSINEIKNDKKTHDTATLNDVLVMITIFQVFFGVIPIKKIINFFFFI